MWMAGWMVGWLAGWLLSRCCLSRHRICYIGREQASEREKAHTYIYVLYIVFGPFLT